MSHGSELGVRFSLGWWRGCLKAFSLSGGGEAVLCDGPEDCPTSAECDEEVSGDFGLARDSLAVVYGEFQGFEFEAVGFNLHFDCPVVVGVAHSEALKRFAADDAEWAEVGVAG